MSVSVIVEEPAWRTSGVRVPRIKIAARLAFEAGSSNARDPSSNIPALTLLLASDERLRRLNRAFRKMDSATNVLSFPAAGNPAGHLGDVAVALGVASAQAASAGITLEAHTLHLVVHGVLHLLGYDHVRAREANRMEHLEIAILDRLGIADPYARAALAG